MCSRAHFGIPMPGEAKQYVYLPYSGIYLDLIKEGFIDLHKVIRVNFADLWGILAVLKI